MSREEENTRIEKLKEQIIKFYNYPNSIDKTAKEFNISKYKLRSFLLSWGIIRNKRVSTSLFSTPKEEILKYCDNHSFLETASYFNIDYDILKKAFKEWGIPLKLKKDVKQEELEKKKEEIILYYKKYGLKNTSSKFHKSNKDMKKLLLDWGVDLLPLGEIHRIGLENAYKEKGSKKAFWEECTRKKRETNSKKYGVEEVFQSEEIKEKSKNTCFKKYNKEHYSKTQECKDRIKETTLKKYGGYPLNNAEIREKGNKTIKEKYGVNHVLQNKEIKEKRDNTLKLKYGENYYNNWASKVKDEVKAKYGVDYYSQTEKFKNILNDKKEETSNKRENTNLEKYGVKFFTQTQDYLDKTRETNLEKYGVEYYPQTEEYKEKLLNTNILKYGVSSYAKTPEYLKRRKETCIEKYGVDSYSKTPSFKDEIKSTMKDKYGVEYALQNPEFLKKKMETTKERYGVSFATQNKEVLDSIRNTFRKNYGVEYACFLPQAQNLKNKESKPNQKFLELLEKNNFKNIDREFVINNYRYDFKINNYLIEIDPSYTHNSTYGIFGEEPKDKNYHLNKTLMALKNDYRCIHVWDWDDENKIMDILHDKEKIYARKCIIKEVPIKETNEFLQENHLQGTCNYQKISLGLYYKNNLVQLMTFGKPRYNKKYQWELLRLCSKRYCMVIGGANKIFKYFIKNYSPISIISYCDLSKFKGNIYLSLGFSHLKDTPPSKHWYSEKLKMHITNNLLIQRGFDQLLGNVYGNYGKGTSNEQLMLEHNFVELYDCGQGVYEWRRI